MDETALIALGILMEETAREALGETGDFAFLEAADEEEAESSSSDSEIEEDEKDMGGRVEPTEGQGTDGWSSSGDESRYSTEESD
jgi:hypothetical protein